MALHAFTPERRHRPTAPWIRKVGLLQLGAPHFLLLLGILAGLLGLIWFALIAHLSSVGR